MNVCLCGGEVSFLNQTCLPDWYIYRTLLLGGENETYERLAIFLDLRYVRHIHVESPTLSTRHGV